MEKTNHNFELVINLLKAVRNKDFGYMLSIFPEGVEYKNYKFITEESFTMWDNYEEYARYNSGAQDMMIKKCLDKVIELLFYMQSNKNKQL
jgi:hypothetical protein